MDRAGDVLELRFEPREERGLRVFVRAVVQAVTLADTIPGNDASGSGGAYVVTRRSDGSEVVRVEVTHDEIGATRLHLEAQLAELSPAEFEDTWRARDGKGRH